jgi:hypothetical protein
MNTQPARLLPWPRYGAFVRAVFDDDLRRLWFFYREQGFQDAEIVDAPVDVNDETGDIDITIVVVEGPRTTVEAVQLPDLDDLPASVPTPVLKLAPGERRQRCSMPIRKPSRQPCVVPAIPKRRSSWWCRAAPRRRNVAGGGQLDGDARHPPRRRQRDRPRQRRPPTRRSASAVQDRRSARLEALRRGQDQVYQLGTYRSVSVEPIEQDRSKLEASVERRSSTMPFRRRRGSCPAARHLQFGAGYNTRDGDGLHRGYLRHLATACRLTLRAGSVVPMTGRKPSSSPHWLPPAALDSDWQEYGADGERSTKTTDQFDVLRGSIGNGSSRPAAAPVRHRCRSSTPIRSTSSPAVSRRGRGLRTRARCRRH